MLFLLYLFLLPSLSLALPFTLPSALLVPRQDDTGCNMNAGSELMQCLGSYASIPPAPEPTGAVIAEQAQQLCEMYTQIANCWGNGTFCREWLPVKTAADKICALASSASSASTLASSTSASSSTPSTTLLPTSALTSASNGTSSLSTLFESLISSEASAITATSASISASTATSSATTGAPESVETVASETFSSVVAEASNVITSIWNNDSGTDIPSISNDIEPTATNPTWTAAEVSQTGGWGPGNGNGVRSQSQAGGEGASGGAAVQSGSVGGGGGNGERRNEVGGGLLLSVSVAVLAVLA
ncbi:hypothetical protein JCM11251_002912 [Rhodosporidiobolus azoricus]